jgi:hypothetical protein
VVAHPEPADHQEAEREREEARNERLQRLPRAGNVRMARQLGNLDLEHQQRDRDREHRVGKEHQPVERQVAAGFAVLHWPPGLRQAPISSRPISMRRISLVPAPMSSALQAIQRALPAP